MKLSVVIPCYNEEKTIRGIVDAVRKSPYASKEIIIVDDCFVFASGARFRKLIELALVFFVSTIGLLVNQLTLFLMIGRIGIEPILAKLTATAVVFFWNYLARAYFVFLPGRAPDN